MTGDRQRITPSPNQMTRLQVLIGEMTPFMNWALGISDTAPATEPKRGHVVIRQHREERDDGRTEEWIEIVEADPLILIAGELIGGASRTPDAYPYVSLERPVTQPPWYGYTGWYFRILGRNQHALYRIGEYRPWSNTWEAAWPD